MSRVVRAVVLLLLALVLAPFAVGQQEESTKDKRESKDEASTTEPVITFSVPVAITTGAPASGARVGRAARAAAANVPSDRLGALPPNVPYRPGATPRGTTRADLAVTAISTTATSAGAGESLPVTHTTKNQGNALAAASVTQFYLSPDRIRSAGDVLLTGSYSVATLAAGATSGSTSNATIPSSMTAGTYYLIGCADDSNTVRESYENNNCMATTTTIQVTATSGRTVTLNRKFTYVTNTGDVVVPDTYTTPVNVLVPNGFGGYATMAATNGGNGQYTVANVPAGPYLAQFGFGYFLTDANTASFDGYILGRQNAVRPTLPTTFTTSVTSAEPYTLSQFHIRVPNAGAGMTLAWASGTATTVFSWPFPTPWMLNLPSGSAGDVAYYSQLSSRVMSTYTMFSLARTWGPFSLTMTDGGSTAINGALSAVTQDKSVEVAVNGAEFVALRSGMGPYDDTFGSFNLWAMPQANKFGYNTAMLSSAVTPTLVIGPVKPGSTTEFSTFPENVSLGPLAYGDPFPTAWDRVAGYLDCVSRHVYVGTADTGAQDSCTGVLQSTLPSAASPLRPLVGPVTAPTVDGGDFFPVAGTIGATPTISWQAPALGTANGYRLDVLELKANDPNAYWDTIAYFYTAGTSITLPSGIVTSPNHYLFWITAIHAGTTDFHTTFGAVLEGSLPYGISQTLSAPFATN